MFQDFDILTFYEVSDEEFKRLLGLFRSGQYQFEWHADEFDMAEHNKLLAETEAEVRDIRAKQRQVQQKMIEAEKESLEKWRADKLKNKPDESTVESLLQDPEIVAVEAPVDANVSILIPVWMFHRANSILRCGRWRSKKATRSKPSNWFLSSRL